MAALLNVQNNICYLDSLKQRYNLLYSKLSNLTDDERNELNNIKKETLETLGQILANNCNDILKSKFDDNVRLISSGISTVLNEKEEELEKVTNENNIANDIIQDIAFSVCRLETLQTNVSIRFDIEKLLFYLKNKVSTIGIIDKKLYVLEYIREKLDNYKVGLYKLVLLCRKRQSKADLSFEEKQEIFECFTNISFEYQYDKNHSKIYNEDLKDKTLNLNTTDYLQCYERIFVDMLDAVGLNPESYLEELISLATDSNVNKVNVEKYITFLGKKYDADLVGYYDALVSKKISCVTDIKNVLRNSLSYESKKDNVYVLNKINKNHRLPECLLNNRYKSYLEDLLFDFEFNINATDKTNNILDEITDIIFEKFDPQKYLEIFEYNSKQKNKQINLYTQYLNELLDDAKDILTDKYINNLENKIEQNMLLEYNTSKAKSDKSKKEKDVAILKRAVQNLRDRFYSFDEYSYNKYIMSFEENYSISGLSNEISIRRKSIFNGFKAKSLNKKDQEYIEEFIKDVDLNKKLIKNIVDDCIIGNESIKYEVLSKILI